jgi:hypothetical protein
VGTNLLQTDVLEQVPEKVEIVPDFHLPLSHGDEDESACIHHSEAKRGTTAFHA